MKPPHPAIEILGEIGTGATARVFHGRLAAPLGGAPKGTEIAVKVLHPELAREPRAREAMEREALVGGRLSDPSLVRVLASGESGGAPFLVLGYVPGHTLREVLTRDGPLPEPLLRRTAAQLFGALATLHGAGIVHGDIKPDNVRLDRADRAVLLDLGFAREVAQIEALGANPGSLAYLSPERARGGPATPAGDVFALGVVLYELGSGHHPFMAAGATQGAAEHSSGSVLRHALEPRADDLLAAIAAGRFVPPSRLVPQLSPFFDALLESALARRPEERPTAAELAARAAGGEASDWWRQRIDAVLAAPGPSPSPRSGQEHLVPRVGRDRELAALGALWRDVGGGFRTALVEGETGSGKSRLMHEFAANARAGDKPPLYVYARCSEHSEAGPLGATVRLVQRWLQLPEETAPGAREVEVIEKLLPPAGAEALLAALDPARAEVHRDSYALSFAAWAAALAREQPIVLALDDLDRASETTLVAVQRLRASLAERGSSGALLLLGLDPLEHPFAPDALARFLERLRSSPDCTQIVLVPWTRVEVEELVNRVFHPAAPRARLARVLFDRSRGNPGLVSELLQRLVERGEAAPRGERDGRLDLLVAPDSLPLPRSIDNTIRERYRGLSPELRLWLDRLAVIGGRVEPDLIQRAFPPTTRPEVDRVLTELVRRGWLVAASNRFRFARPSLRETLYRALTEARRKRLHRMAARALEAEPGAPVRVDDAWQRVFHLRSAGEWRAVLHLVRPLLAHATRRGYPQRALQLARSGLEALDALGPGARDPDLELELLEAAADAADRVGARDEERELLDRLAARDPDPEKAPSVAARVYLLHGRYAVATGQYGLARGMLKNTVQLAERAGEASIRSEALRRLGHVQSHVGMFDEGRELLDQAEALATDDNQLALAWLARAQLEVHDDRIEPALAYVDRALRLLRRADPPRPGSVALAHVLRARIFRSSGRAGRALGAAKHAVALAKRAGERRTEAEALARQGGLSLDLDRVAEAEELLHDSLALAEEIEDRRSKALSSLWLAILLWENDDPGATASIERALAAAREIGFYRAEAMGLAIRARIRRASATGGGRRLDEALADSSRAQTIVERHGAELLDRVAVTGTHALLLHTAGRRAESREVVLALRRRMRRDNARIEDAALRRAQRAYSTRLLEAVLSPDGPVFPRVSGVAM